MTKARAARNIPTVILFNGLHKHTSCLTPSNSSKLVVFFGLNPEINVPEVQPAHFNQWIHHKVHDWHQNQDQDGVDSLVGEKGRSLFYSEGSHQPESYQSAEGVFLPAFVQAG